MSNSEYILRDAVDAKLLAMEERFIDNPFALTAIAMAMNEIDKITAADVAPVVHGRWIAITADVHRCSNCDQLVRTKDIVPYRFCNVCGAKMDEEDEE